MTKSLRIRFILILLFFSLLPGIIMRNVVLTRYERHSIQEYSARLESQLSALANRIAAGGIASAADSDILADSFQSLSAISVGRVLVVDTAYRIVYDSFSEAEDGAVLSPGVIQAMSGKSSVREQVTGDYVEIVVPIRMVETEETDAEEIEEVETETANLPEAGEVIGSVICLTAMDRIVGDTDSIRVAADLVLLGVLLCMLLISLLLASLLDRPIRRVREAASAIAAGYEDTTPQIQTYSELQDILEAFDESIAKMKTMDESRTEFVSNVSHELKTPIASMKVLADSLLMQPDVPNEIYQEFMHDIAQEIDRESNIINDLLALVRLENSEAMTISSLNINDLLEFIMKRMRPIANQKQVELVLESFRPVVAEVDETKLSQALTNLIENAVKYNHENGWVHVSLNADHQYFYIRVSDSGIGIPEEDQERVFDRFYRVDKSHSKEIGGTGLGLAITKNVIQMHKGQIKLHSNEEEGSTFHIRIPLYFVR